MMGGLGQQDGYPVGVDNSHPHFYGGEPECACGHVLDEHDGVGECQVDDCPCFAYEEAEPAEPPEGG